MTEVPASDALHLHRDALVVDAASFFCTRYDDDLAASGVDVVSVMAPWPGDDFERAVRRLEALLAHFGDAARVRKVRGSNLLRLHGSVWQ